MAAGCMCRAIELQPVLWKMGVVRGAGVLLREIRTILLRSKEMGDEEQLHGRA